MLRKIFPVYVIFATLVFQGCYYDVEEELYPDNATCITDSITYILTVRPILDQNCMECHNAVSNLGNVTLETYSDVAGVASSGQLVGAISHDPAYAAMPQGKSMLDDCTILKIETWVLAGSPNN